MAPLTLHASRLGVEHSPGSARHSGAHGRRRCSGAAAYRPWRR